MSTATPPTLEGLAKRIAALEDEVACLLQRREPPLKKGWRHAVGMYGDDPEMKEMVELGKKMRDAEEPNDLPILPRVFSECLEEVIEQRGEVLKR